MNEQSKVDALNEQIDKLLTKERNVRDAIRTCATSADPEEIEFYTGMLAEIIETRHQLIRDAIAG